MKKLLILTSLSLCVSIAFAQTENASKYAALITGDGLKKQLTLIASDEMEGRETGTEGQRKASIYIESQFKAMGLKTVKALNGFQQLYPLYQDSLQKAELTINGNVAEFGKDFITPLNTNETGKFKGKKIIFAGYGIDDPKYTDYEGLDVKGKLVIFFLGEPKKDGKYIISGTTRGSEWTFPGISKKIAAAAAKGAIGALVINPIILAEVSPRFERAADLEAALADLPLVREALPWDAAFLAGQAFKVYRQSRGANFTAGPPQGEMRPPQGAGSHTQWATVGANVSPMPDFYIGAHALVGGMQLVTRDAARYRSYFPNLPLVAP